MNKKFKLKKSIRLVTATLAGSMTMAGAVSAETNIFSVQELPGGYMLAGGHLEGGCGADRKIPAKEMEDAGGMKDGEGHHDHGEGMKDGEGHCGHHGEGMKDGEGHCGHHGKDMKDAGGMKDAEGKCGEGKCGESMEK